MAQKEVTLKIKSIENDRNGRLVIVTESHPEYNAKGAFVMKTEAQEQRILNRVGINSVFALKHIIEMSNGTSKLSFLAEPYKAGDVWDNGLEGAARKSGIHEKDGVRINNESIELGMLAKLKLGEAAINSIFTSAPMPTRNTTPVIQQPAPQPAVVNTTVTDTTVIDQPEA